MALEVVRALSQTGTTHFFSSPSVMFLAALPIAFVLRQAIAKEQMQKLSAQQRAQLERSNAASVRLMTVPLLWGVAARLVLELLFWVI